MTNQAADNGVGDTTSFVVLPRCSDLTIPSLPSLPSLSTMMMTTTTMTGSRRPRYQRPQPPSSTSSSSSSVSSMDADRGEEDGRRDCLAAAGGCSARITGHHWMGGAAHGFVRPPLRLTAETATMAASAGGPAGPPPRLRACQQARAAARDDNEDYDRVRTKERATRCAGGQRPATQLLTIAGWRATTKRAVDKSKQQPTIAH